MKTKLPLLALVLSSTLAFSQSNGKVERQASKYPQNPVSAKAAVSSAASLKNVVAALPGEVTVFQENFDGAGPGFAAWTTIDVDGLNPAAAVNFITTGWNRIDKLGANGNFGGPAGDYAAMSTSWYSPAGTSNDWLISPSIAIPTGTTQLQWEAKAQDADYPDGYRLMLSPTAGNAVGDFTVELYSIAAENADWETRTVDLSAYAGTNVTIAFVNNSTDMFMLLVDNILVSNTPPVIEGGCLDTPNGQYPIATFTPACNGTAQNITTQAWTGEYSNVQLTAGTAYTFSSSVSTHQITIADAAGTTILAAGIGSVVYTPTADGVVRFITHLNADCGVANTSHARIVTCGTPPPPPVEPEYGCTDQEYSAGEPLLANNTTESTANGSVYVVANDFFVPADTETFTLNTMKAHFVPTAGGTDLTSFDVTIMEDNNMAPGTVIHTLTGLAPTSVTQLPDTFANYATFEITLDLGGYELTGVAGEAKRYWIGIHSTSAAGGGIFWIGYEYTPGFTTQYNFQSTDGGTTFIPIVSTDIPGANFDSFMTVDATCTTMAVGEVNSKKVSYYPNPVRDILTITSKQKIETVHVYNVAGQKMNVPAKMNNNQIDMSRMAPGVYIISTIAADGTNESFKVIKK